MIILPPMVAVLRTDGEATLLRIQKPLKLSNALGMVPAIVGERHQSTELREGAHGATVVGRQLADIRRLVTLLPEAVEAQILEVNVGREALAGINNGPVPGTAAEIAGDSRLGLGSGELGEAGRRSGATSLLVGLDERGEDGHAHAGRAEAALRGMEAGEALLHGVVAIPGVADALAGGDRAAVHAVKQRQAGARRELGHLVGGRVVLGDEDHTCTTATYLTWLPSPQPSLGPLTGVWVRKNSSRVVDGSTPAASYRLPFTASTTVAIFSEASLTTTNSALHTGVAPEAAGFSIRASEQQLTTPILFKLSSTTKHDGISWTDLQTFRGARLGKAGCVIATHARVQLEGTAHELAELPGKAWTHQLTIAVSSVHPSRIYASAVFSSTVDTLSRYLSTMSRPQSSLTTGIVAGTSI
ncbi:hypothetical protein EJB05_04136, partial [Eragrostis curvula]